MRDPKRIPKIVEELEATWLLYPDMRLGQLIGCAHAYAWAREPGEREPPDVFTTEDYLFSAGLRAMRIKRLSK